MSQYQAKALSPILPVEDLARSIRFYTEVLGFTLTREMPTYAIVANGAASLHLTLAEADAVRGNSSIYLEVANIAALWAAVSPRRDRYKMRDLFDREYGMREFHVVDPDGCLIFVGEEIRPTMAT